MSKETQHTVVLELGAGGGPGAGPGVVAVDLDGLTIRENVSQIACPYRPGHVSSSGTWKPR